MAPMTSKASLKPMKPGEYQGDGRDSDGLDLANHVSVKKGGKPMGSVQTTLTAR